MGRLHRIHPSARRALLALCVALAAALGQAGSAHASNGCDRVAAPDGSDAAGGTEAAPYRSLQKLTGSIQAGETACLRAGSYGGEQVWLERPDTTLKSYPGERATVTAFLEVTPEAARAQVSGLKFDARNNGNEVGVKLQADGTVFSDNELTKGGRGICLVAASYNAAQHVVIERNRIYDCGPSDSKWDHQIYLVHSRGAVVRWNILSGNAGGWGVHLYTDADNTVIEHNVIDGNHGGVIFAGDGGETSDHNVVRNNAITFSGPRWNVEGSWSGGPSGSGNDAHDNCLASRDGGGGVATEEGFSARENVAMSGSPYVNRSEGDYHFKASSACAALVGDVMGRITGVPGPTGDAPLELILHPASSEAAPNRGVALTGEVVTRRAGASRKRRAVRGTVRLQYRSRRGWRTLGHRRMRRGRFWMRVRIPGSRSARVVRVRAVLPQLARSHSVKLRVRR